MRIDVVFGAGTAPASEFSGRVVAVIDVLRASTSIAAALANGARAVVPVESSDAAVEGKTVLMTTTNGTPAIMNTPGARDVVIASYVNYTAVLTMLRAALRGGTDITIVCAGRDRQFALEDAGCAGRFVYNVTKRLGDVELNDAAQACALIDRKYGDQIVKLFEASEHGQLLRDSGFADDLEECAAIDSYPVIPLYQERQITKLGPERER